MKNLEEEKESTRQQIMAFWEKTGENMEERNEFLAFLEVNGIGKNSIYTYMRGECRRMPLFKMKGLKVCIEEFQRKTKKSRSVRR